MAIAAIGTMTGAAVMSFVATGAPAGAVGCSGDTWTNSSGGSWDTNGNWSLNAPPGTGAAACITAPGTYTVTIGNETINAGAVTLGGSGSTPTLAIGNSGSGEPAVTFASVTNSTGSSLTFNWGGTLAVTGAFTNAGTVDESLNTPSAFSIGSFDNQGLFQTGGGSTYTLPSSSSTFLNDSTGTLDVPSATSLTFSSPGGNTGTFTQDGIIDVVASNALTVSDAVVIDGGSICGAPLEIGTDGGSVGTLTFAASVGSGSCNSGSLKDNIDFANVSTNGKLSGNIPAAYTVEMGNGGSSESNITFLGAITNSGTLEPGWEGTFTDTSTLTNKGTLEVPASSFSSIYNFTNLVNKGKFTVNAPVTMNLPSTGALSNTSTGTITVATGQSLAISSTASPQGTVSQDGIIDNNGTVNVEAPVSISGGSICGNRVNIGLDGQASQGLTFVGAVVAGPACATGLASDQLFMANITGTLNGNVPKGYTVLIGDGGSSFAHIASNATTNAGVLEPEDGATLTFTGSSFTNTGTLEFPSNPYTSTEFVFGSNVTNSGKITAQAGGTFVLPAGDTVTNGKKIKIAGTGTVLNITGSLDNTKVLQIAAGDAVDVTGTYTQSSLGSFKPALASSTSIGLLNVTGTASIAGTVSAKLAGGFHPSVGATWIVLKSAGLGGTTFTTVSGTFSAQYVSSDSNVQLTFT